MKRYRVLNFDFDSSATVLTVEIRDEWDEHTKELYRNNKRRIKEGLIHEYGEHQADQKLQNLGDLGSKPLSIVAFHNRFADQVRRAFIVGANYPALTGACALGERILNHLVLALRKDFRSTPEYKKIYRKHSFDDWALAIDTLESWQVLLPEVVKAFRELAKIRHRAIHFNPEVDRNDRALALKAIGCLYDIISTQFGAFGRQPWFIPDIPGESYIKRDAETEPFVRSIYLPNCRRVGPKHRLELDGCVFNVRDDTKYEDREISDEEFRGLRKRARGA